MPTARRRHQVTETDEVAAALDRAERRWPGESRGRLLVRLIECGAAHLDREVDAARTRRRRHFEALAAKYSGTYPQGYLEDLRKDWPA